MKAPWYWFRGRNARRAGRLRQAHRAARRRRPACLAARCRRGCASPGRSARRRSRASTATPAGAWRRWRRSWARRWACRRPASPGPRAGGCARSPRLAARVSSAQAACGRPARVVENSQRCWPCHWPASQGPCAAEALFILSDVGAGRAARSCRRTGRLASGVGRPASCCAARLGTRQAAALLRAWRRGRQDGQAPPAARGRCRRAQAREVCHLVALRGATLAAAAIAGLLRVMGRDGAHTAMQPTAIVVDGGLFAHYGAFRGCARRACRPARAQRGPAGMRLPAVAAGHARLRSAPGRAGVRAPARASTWWARPGARAAGGGRAWPADAGVCGGVACLGMHMPSCAELLEGVLQTPPPAWADSLATRPPASSSRRLSPPRATRCLPAGSCAGASAGRGMTEPGAAQVHRGRAGGAAGPARRGGADAAAPARRVLARRSRAGGGRRARAGVAPGGGRQGEV
jgi:hypothetical protein